jgi:hypothetical protein
VTATATGTTTANFALTNTAGTATSVSVSAGSPQSTTVGLAFATNLAALVVDQFANPKPGAVVTFTAPASGASGAFANNTATTQATTGANGIATASVLTANHTAGGYSATAKATTTNTATFALTNRAGAATTMSAAAGSSQSTPVGTTFGTTLVALVVDQFANPVSGAVVTFTAPASGASGTFANNTATTQATTAANGRATATAFKANTVVGGPYSTVASKAGLTSVNFALTNRVGAPRRVSVSAGSPQSRTVGTAFTTALSALVVDRFGNPVPGVALTFTAPATGPSGAFANNTATTQATTNAAGVGTASAFTANHTAGGPYNVGVRAAGTNTATFALTNSPGAATTLSVAGGSPQSTPVGTAFASNIAALIVDQFGNPVPGVTVTFTAPASGASGTFANATPTTPSTSAANGVATASVFTAGQVAGAYNVVASAAGVPSLNLPLTNEAGPATTLSISAGSAQSAKVSTAFATTMAARVVDEFGNAVAGVVVTFTAPASGASGTFANGTATTQATTNASGIATATTFTANSTAGSYSVAATSPLTNTVNFALTNNP